MLWFLDGFLVAVVCRRYPLEPSNFRRCTYYTTVNLLENEKSNYRSNSRFHSLLTKFLFFYFYHWHLSLKNCDIISAIQHIFMFICKKGVNAVQNTIWKNSHCFYSPFSHKPCITLKSDNDLNHRGHLKAQNTNIFRQKLTRTASGFRQKRLEQ